MYYHDKYLKYKNKYLQLTNFKAHCAKQIHIYVKK